MTNQPSTARKVSIFCLKLLLLSSAIAIVSSRISWEDIVVTKSGSQYSGTITAGFSENNATVVIEDDEGQIHKIAGEEVEEKKYGIATTIPKLSLGPYLLGMALILGVYLFGIARWRLLLHAQGLEASYWRAFRLTFIGFFWNNFMPGMTGGDVAKAVIVAKDAPGRRSQAVSTVIADRVIGLAVLACVSGLAILSNFSAFKQQGYIVFAVLIACCILFVCFFSKRVRRTLKISEILRRLPLNNILKKLDEAFHGYRAHPRALVWSLIFSVGAHSCNITSVYVFGHDLGIEEDLVTYFATVPIIYIVASVPLFPGGWGVRELAFVAAFTAVGVPAALSSNLVLLSVLVGLSTTCWSLFGGLFLFLGQKEGEIPSDLSALEE